MKNIIVLIKRYNIIVNYLILSTLTKKFCNIYSIMHEFQLYKIINRLQKLLDHYHI